MLHGDSAGTLVVTARTRGGQRDRDGVGVFLVPANANGVRIKRVNGDKIGLTQIKQNVKAVLDSKGGATTGTTIQILGQQAGVFREALSDPRAKEEITHLSPDKLGTRILQKELRIAEIMGNIRTLLAKQ